MTTDNKPKRRMGAPTMFGKRMKQTAFFLPEEMIEWIDQQVAKRGLNNRSDYIRKLIQRDEEVSGVGRYVE